ncbi:MAG: MFS transporter [Anaerolineae bacterium]|nr:MFS transporter [Anaerolineae bacterium]
MNTTASAAYPRGVRGYALLLKNNPNVRNLWFGQVVSDIGDWFNTVAVLGLILELSGSALGGSLQVVLQYLPSAIFGLFISGYVADRFDRRHVMLISHFARALVALSFLLIRSADTLWIGYVATALLSVGQSFFGPASSAALPNLCKPEELPSAVSLQQSSFAGMLFFGAFLGALVTEWLGREAAFILNGLSFLGAAWFIWRIKASFSSVNSAQGLSGSSTLRALTDGFRYLKYNATVLAFVLFKPIWGITVGAIGLYSAYAYQVYNVGSTGISWLYAGRGLGGVIGPIVFTTLIAPKTTRQFVGVLMLSIALVFFGYGIYGISTGPVIGALGTFIGHLGGASVFAFTRLFMQREVPDRLRGRVFSLDSVAFWLSNSASTLMMGYLATQLGPQSVVLGGVCLTALLAAIWGGIVWFRAPVEAHR